MTGNSWQLFKYLFFPFWSRFEEEEEEEVSLGSVEGERISRPPQSLTHFALPTHQRGSDLMLSRRKGRSFTMFHNVMEREAHAESGLG